MAILPLVGLGIIKSEKLCKKAGKVIQQLRKRINRVTQAADTIQQFTDEHPLVRYIMTNKLTIPVMLK